MVLLSVLLLLQDDIRGFLLSLLGRHEGFSCSFYRINIFHIVDDVFPADTARLNPPSSVAIPGRTSVSSGTP